MSTDTETGADDIRWDLSDLHQDPEAVQESLSRANEEAEAFADAHKGRIADLGAEALDRLS